MKRREGPMTAAAMREKKGDTAQKIKPWDPTKGEKVGEDALEEPPTAQSWAKTEVKPVSMPSAPPASFPSAQRQMSMGGAMAPKPDGPSQPMPQTPPGQAPAPMPMSPPQVAPQPQKAPPPPPPPPPRPPAQQPQRPPVMQRPAPPPVPPPTSVIKRSCPTCRALIEPGWTRCPQCGRHV